MTKVVVGEQQLTVEPEGLDKFWSFKWRLQFPLVAVSSATVKPYKPARVVFGLRFPGTHLPGTIKAGTFIEHGETAFWLVRRAPEVLVIELEHQKYARLVLEVPNPNALVHTIYHTIHNTAST